MSNYGATFGAGRHTKGSSKRTLSDSFTEDSDFERGGGNQNTDLNNMVGRPGKRGDPSIDSKKKKSLPAHL